jgi:hypothetical protein
MPGPMPGSAPAALPIVYSDSAEDSMRFAPGVNWEFRHSSGIYLIAQPGSGKAPLRWKSILSALFLPAINHGAARRDARDA